MALSIVDLGAGPPRILIYGEPGIGKTTLASEFPNPIFIQIEDGAPPHMAYTTFGVLTSFEQVMEKLEELYNEEHNHQTVVVDSITEMQRLVWAETCRRGDEKGHKKERIEDFGYGKGYVNALAPWREFIEGLHALRRDKGMAVVLIAHAKVDRFDDPETVSYHRYEIDLHDKAVGAIERDMDAILLLKKPVTILEEDIGFNKTRTRAGGSADTVYIHTRGRPAFIAKNRYRMPEKILFTEGKGFAELAKYLPGAAAAAEPAKAA